MLEIVLLFAVIYYFNRKIENVVKRFILVISMSVVAYALFFGIMLLYDSLLLEYNEWRVAAYTQQTLDWFFSLGDRFPPK